jgi:hypothetical protein
MCYRFVLCFLSSRRRYVNRHLEGVSSRNTIFRGFTSVFYCLLDEFCVVVCLRARGKIFRRSPGLRLGNRNACHAGMMFEEWRSHTCQVLSLKSCANKRFCKFVRAARTTFLSSVCPKADMLRRPGESAIWWVSIGALVLFGLGLLLVGHSVNFWLIAVEEERHPVYHYETHDLCHSLSYLWAYLIIWFSVLVFLLGRNRFGSQICLYCNPGWRTCRLFYQHCLFCTCISLPPMVVK